MGGDVSSLSTVVQQLDATLQRHAAVLGQNTTATATLNTSINTLNGTIAAGTTQVQGFTNALGALGNPLAAINNPLGVAGRLIQQFASSLGPVGVGAIAAGVGVAILAKGVLDLVSSQAQAARELANFAARLDISVGTAQRLQFQAALTGVNLKTLEQSVRTLSNALDDPGATGKKQIDILNKLGISTRDATGNQKELGSVVEEVLSQLSSLGNAAERAHDGQVLLGRSSKELLPLIEQYQATKAASEAFADSLDENANKRLEEARRVTTELGIAFDILKKNLAAKIAPIEISFVQTVSRYFTGPKKDDTDFNTSVGNSPLGYVLGLPGQVGADDLRRVNKHIGDNVTATGANIASKDAEDQINDRIKRIQDSVSTPLERLQSKLKEVEATLPDLKKGVGITAESGNAYQNALNSKASIEAQIAGLHANTEALKAFNSLLKERDAGADKRSFGDGPGGRLFGARDADLRKNADVANAAGKSSSQLDSDTDAQYVNQIGDVFRKYREEAVKAAQKDVSLYANEAAKPENFDDKQFLKTLRGSIKDDTADQAIANRISATNANDQVQVLKDQFGKASAINSAKYSDDPVFAANTAYQEQLSLAQQIFAIRLDELTTAKELATIGNDKEAQEKADLDLSKARKELDDENAKAALQRTLQGYQDQKQQLDAVKSASGGIFDALTSKGSRGLSTYIQAQGKQIEKTLFENTAGIAYQSLGGGGANGIGSILPGQRDDSGQLTTFGKFLSGTILGNKGSNPQIDAQKDNTSAIINLTSVITSIDDDPGSGSSSSSGGSFSIPGLGRFSGASSLFKLFGGSSGSSSINGSNSINDDPGSFSVPGSSGGSSASSSYNGNGFSGLVGGLGHTGDLQGIFTGVSSLPGGGAQSLSTSEQIGGAIGTAGVLIGGISSAVKDFSKGGARGILGGAGALAGTASALDVEPISKAILAGFALTSGIVGSLLGDPHAARAKQEAATIHNSMYSQALDNPTQNESYDISGNAAYTNSSGNNQIVNHNYTIQVQALDASSIIQRSSDISDAVHASINTGHPIVNAINNLSA